MSSPPPEASPYTAAAIAEWMREEIASLLDAEPDAIDLETPFLDLGLDSVTGLELMMELEAWLRGPIPPTLLGEHDTIRRAAQALARP
jgi:acyl carrier protein